jgi:sulfatase maturation enzyme AslB (radical SAM superfamily)
MYCPRLKHFVRLNQDGSIGKCGHMINAMGFKTFDKLDNSKWLKDIKDTMAKDEWPNECKRCQQTEELNGESIRTKSIERHKILHPRKDDYLVVGGVLDNVCNSACQTCNAGLSTKIGSLKSKNYPKVNNYETFWKLPQNRILEVDVNGGEPTASKNYKKILANLPPNTKIVRMNTNGSRMIRELETILRNRTMVIVTLSFDGTGDVHDYVRWPIKWKHYTKTVQAYKDLQKQYPLLKLNCWTTVSSLNVENLPNILDFATEQGLDHDWAFLNTPDQLNVKYKNKFTISAKKKLMKSPYAVCRDISDKLAIGPDNDSILEQFIRRQDKLRKINIKDYLNFLPK